MGTVVVTETEARILWMLEQGPVGPMPFVFDPDNPNWDADTTYAPRAAVLHDHSLWMATVASTGVEPGADPDAWLLLLDGASAADLAEAVAASQVAEALAEKWAGNPEDAAVETGKFSARHWAAKAADDASAVGSAVASLKHVFGAQIFAATGSLAIGEYPAIMVVPQDLALDTLSIRVKGAGNAQLQVLINGSVVGPVYEATESAPINQAVSIDVEAGDAIVFRYLGGTALFVWAQISGAMA